MKLKDRPKDEQEAIMEYIKVSHPSNVPKNIDNAKWAFFKNRKTGGLTACV